MLSGRQVVADADRHARQRLQAIDDRVMRLHGGVDGRVLAVRQADAERQRRVGIEAGIDRAQVLNAAHHQSRRRPAASAPSPPARRAAGGARRAAAAWRCCRGRFRAARAVEAPRHSGMAPNTIAATSDSSGDVADRDRLAGESRAGAAASSAPTCTSTRSAAPRDEQPERAAGDREQHALGEEVAPETEARGPERSTNGHLTLAQSPSARGTGWRRSRTRPAAPRRPRRAESSARGRCRRASRSFSVRPTKVSLVLTLPARARIVRIGVGDAGDQPLQLRARRLQRHALAQPRHALRGRRSRTPCFTLICSGIHTSTRGNGNANPGGMTPTTSTVWPLSMMVWPITDGLLAESPRPQAMRQHGHHRPAGLAFVFGEPAAERRTDAQHRFERRRGARHDDPLRLAAAGQRPVAAAEERRRFQRLRSVAIEEVHARACSPCPWRRRSVTEP